MPNNNSLNFWAVIPAAGSGKRVQSSTPKQYLNIADKTVIEHTLSCFLDHDAISSVVVVLQQDDAYWSKLKVSTHSKVITTIGGAERYHSVINGLSAIANQAKAEDWVLVHDAARPCLEKKDIDKLITKLSQHEVGGILAIPVNDTIKQTDASQHIQTTIDRSYLWQALTPQMFRYGKLSDALLKAQQKNILVTDESMAMELAGFKPCVIEGHKNNIKITHSADLQSAEIYLKQAS